MKLWCSLSLLFFVTACGEKELTVAQVCQENPAICNDLNVDSHCNMERRDVILSRYHEQKMPSDPNKYQLLIHFERYSKCIELASGIEHIKLKEKRTSRVKGYLTSLDEIKRLADETVSSEYPPLLYYHWSHHGSQSHLDRFLLAEKQNKLQAPELQVALASYYMKRNPKKTMAILQHALTLYPEGAKVDHEIYTALTTLYYQQRRFDAAYHWALIAADAGVTRIEFQTILKDLDQQSIDTATIKAMAEENIELISEGKFKPISW